MLNNPLVKQLVKNFLPDMINSLGEGENALIDYIKSFPLEDDETDVVLFTDIDKDEETGKETVFLVIGAFTGNTFTRIIEAKPAREFLKNIIETNFKK